MEPRQEPVAVIGVFAKALNQCEYDFQAPKNFSLLCTVCQPLHVTDPLIISTESDFVSDQGYC
jgi:hypothetical protein